MKALVKYAKGPGNLEIREIPIPKIGPDDVLMKVHASGICGTDVHIYHDEYSIYQPPLTIGHEFSAVVADVGKNVTHVKPGDRVVSDLMTEKGLMGNDVVDGAHAEYVAMPKNQIHKLPDNISLREAALMELVACCQHGLLERTRIKPGDFVVITGPGPIGCMMAQIARLHSPRAILITGLRGTDEFRLSVAKKFADYALFNDEDVVETVKELTDGKGADIAIQASGADEALQQCIDLVKMGGQINNFGVYDNEMVSANLSHIAWKCLDVKGSWGWWGYPEKATRTTGGAVTWERAIRIAELGKIDFDSMITHEIPLEDWKKGFEICEQRKGVKVLLTR